MNAVFADSFYFIAFVNERDSAHVRASAFGKTFNGSMFTTAWIITELADAFAHPNRRSLAVRLIKNLEQDPVVTIVPPSPSLFSRGLNLYFSRPDQAWSLTDCISFVVMQDEGLTDALTGDHHFEPAGFKALLK